MGLVFTRRNPGLSALPRFYSSKVRVPMNLNREAPISELLEDLQVVSSQVGLSLDDVKLLLASGLTIGQLLDYVEAVVSDQVN